jgi:ADP-ribose pyrophosphatase YjhB (NUDIX family)
MHTKRQAVRAIIIRQGHLLVMHRNKFGTEYYTLPGGGIDPGETPEQALLRELAEETGVAVAINRLVIVEEAGDPYGTQAIYLCDYQAGEPALHPESEDAQINALGQNLHTPMWLPLERLATVPFKSDKLQLKLGEFLQNDWPEQPVVL